MHETSSPTSSPPSSAVEPHVPVPVPGMHNLRDLGGLPTRDGRRTVRGVLYRGDAPEPDLAQGVARLRELGVRTVVDLREPHERAERPNPLAGDAAVAYHAVDLIAGLRDGWSELTSERPLGALYVRALERAGSAFVRTVDGLVTGTGAGVVHCSAGEDRTGMVAALVLDAVGVPRSVVVHDYVVTARYARPIFERLRERARRRGDAAALERLLSSDAVDIEAFLTALHEVHGGAEAYLTGHGLEADRLRWLRASWTEDAAGSA